MSQATLGSGPYRNSNLFSGYYLDERVADLDAWDCDDEATEAFERIRDLWNKEGALLPSYNEDELIDTWIAEVIDIIGHGTSSEVTLPNGGGYVDRLLFENDDVRREGAKRALDGDHEGLFSRASAILEAKQWDADFEQRFAEQRSYRDASHQIKYYLERTPGDLRWGVLTDGKKWRLYGTKDYETQTYYEVDLPEILESGDLEAFKYFFAFFRPEAFVEHAGSSFLDDVWTESETAAQELGEDLQDNVFRALRVLGKGFVESNDLDVGPDGDVGRDELKEQSLVLLYRLMFVLYAESRGLIDPDDSDASEEYHEYFSLEVKREEILDDVEGMNVESGEAFTEEYSRFSTSIWGRLSELFELIDEGEESLDIPPYNGGLFSREDHAFLDDYEVKDPYIAEVIYWLSTTENEDGEHVPADYADLDTRHLGSIYEGLLEHEFRIADAEGVAAVSEDGGQVWKPASEVTAAEAVEIVEEGGLYVVNDEGERKATGAYYTPDYVVTYIVEETVDPLIEEIDEDLREKGLEPSDQEYFLEFYQRVQDLRVLDPAMGSGHFLTKATGYLTEKVMGVVREQEIQSYDEQEIRREISKEVIYGVDINGMAVELSKLSMWLETLAADQPLAFLDHHLKPGNSLVGSDITEVLSDDTEESGGQLTLTQAFARVRQDTLRHVMDLMADLLAYDNDSLDSVKSMEDLYDEIRDDPLFTRLFELANIHTAEVFGCDVPEDAYEQMAGAIEDEDDWASIRGEDWFTAAQETADEQDFFHWELEFPEVFFDADGEKMPEAGFDAVVGNPPWVSNWEISESDEDLPGQLEQLYPTVTTGHWDLFVLFIQKSINLTRTDGYHSFITPSTLATEKYGSILRKKLIEEHTLEKLVGFGERKVFPEVDRQCMVYILSPEKRNEQVDIVDYTDSGFSVEYSLDPKEFLEFSNNSLRLDISPSDLDIKNKLESSSVRLQEICCVNPGVVAHSAEDSPRDFGKDDVLTKEDGDGRVKYISGSEIGRHRINWEGNYLMYEEYKEHFHRPKFEELFESEKVMVSGISGSGSSIKSCYDSSGFYTNHNILQVVHWGQNILDHRTPQGHEILDSLDEYSIRYLGAILNSKLISYYFSTFLATGTLQGSYSSVYPEQVRQMPIHKLPEEASQADFDLSSELGITELEEEFEQNNVTNAASARDLLSELLTLIREYNDRRVELSVDILEHLTPVETDLSIIDAGLLQPSSETNTALTETSESRSKLRLGTARVDRVSPNTVLIEATARYKPDDEDAYETDQWGYTETEYLPAFRITDLTEREADLIEHFVPVAVDEAGGFANFRETATKTNSLVDRLKAIELPDIDDVANDLVNYLRTKERAEELDAKIEQADRLIDEIVYELYELTEKEIEIVEEAVEE